MSKKNRNMHVVALQTTVATLTAEKLALTEALGQLGYCHEQQTTFITESMSGPHGALSLDLLLREAKAALAEAIETNKGLTDDVEFQEYRYKNLLKSHGQLGRTCYDLSNEREALKHTLYWTRRVAIGAGVILLGMSALALRIVGA